MSTIRSRLLIIALLVAGSVFFLLPRNVTERAYDPVSAQMRDTTVRRVPINLGLDLRGGMHIGLEVDESQATVADCADAISRAERVVRSRISEFGTTAPVIQIAGQCRLIVELPGERDPARARAIVQRTAFLELRLIDAQSRFDAAAQTLTDSLGMTGSVLRGGMPGEYLVAERDVGRVQRLLETSEVRRLVPRDIELRWGSDVSTAGGGQLRPLYAVESGVILTGEQLVEAVATLDPMTNQPQVQFELTRSAGVKFGEVTARHVGSHLAILLDGRVQGPPAMIRERIGAAGRIELTGRTLQEASDLALVLRAGALPAPLRIVEERTIGPSLGIDSIRAGVRTALLAVAFVVLIMTVYYRFSGVLAVCALFFYLLYSLGGLAVLGYTLTLPGLAGFALAIGMAVDANVLIFERIREELRRGHKVAVAVDRGFRHALSAIIDSNVTTALTASILYVVGTDAVQGFAVTLLIGLCASMLSAIFVTRTLFSIWLRYRPGLTTLKHRTIRGVTHAAYDFMRAGRRIGAVSGAVILLGLGMIAVSGVNYGIDFTGGALLQIETREPVTTTAVRSALGAAGFGSAEIQRFGSDREYIIRTTLDPSQKSEAALATTSAEVGRALDSGLGRDTYKFMRTEVVTPEVGGELQEKAVAAIAASFVATLAYVALRFEWRFAVAAVAATAHDILATVAFMRFLDLEVSLVTVAGVLTVIGYSLNDTIVIFDRMRENLRNARKPDLRAIANASINETLPRTILTAGTTLVAALLLAGFAGAVIRPFAVVMSFGIAVGTLSSIYIASPALLWLHRGSSVRKAKRHLEHNAAVEAN